MRVMRGKYRLTDRRVRVGGFACGKGRRPRRTGRSTTPPSRLRRPFMMTRRDGGQGKKGEPRKRARRASSVNYAFSNERL